MEIYKHPACTHSIGAPSDMQDGSCSALPVAYVENEYGLWAMSFWKPSEAELAALQIGGTIALMVRAPGRQHPVVSVAVAGAVEESHGN